MLSLFGVACVLSASAGATVWIDARHLNEDIKYLGNATFNTAVPSAQGSVDIAQEGDYSVWVWAPDGTKHQVALSNQRFLIEQPENKKTPGRYEWSNAGTLHLPAGPAHVAFFSQPLDASGGLGFPRIAACVLTTNPELKPEKLLGDRSVFDQPRAAEDRRAAHAKHTNTVFTMPEFASTEAWEAYTAELRARALLSSGVWPLPEKTPLNAEVTDTIDRGEYSVSKVRFEAYPGFLVTGNLYKPAGEGPFPAVVNPHGHWEKGRLENSDKCSVPGRAITLAKLGMVAFTYDMVGYNDSLQF
ncbi:MAG: hypothetical protein HYV26_21835, partial [Candidatus Hydrogenedentes bacterium]|nr:hypothetical protein [Candidatus Hydrogenedentota bacterium]